MKTPTLVLFCVVAVCMQAALAETPASDTWLNQTRLQAASTPLQAYSNGTTGVADSETKTCSCSFMAPARAPKQHTIEGVAGGVLVPTAYLMNPGPKDEPFGMPAISTTFIGMCGRKNLLTMSVSETFWGRLELSYALGRMDTGNLNHVVKKTINNYLEDRNIYMHMLNARFLLIEENSWDIPVPAVTVGAHFKCNDSISDINSRLGIPLDVMGYDDHHGMEYTVMATKTMQFDPIPPIEVSVGLRNTRASNIGYLGFADECKTLLELGVTMYATDWLSVRYEFRRKEKALGDAPVGGMLEGEENWHGINVAMEPIDNLSINVGVGFFGDVANQKDAVGPSVSLAYAF